MTVVTDSSSSCTGLAAFSGYPHCVACYLASPPTLQIKSWAVNPGLFPCDLSAEAKGLCTGELPALTPDSHVCWLATAGLHQARWLSPHTT